MCCRTGRSHFNLCSWHNTLNFTDEKEQNPAYCDEHFEWDVLGVADSFAGTVSFNIVAIALMCMPIPTLLPFIAVQRTER
ncbi:hypothetical protein Plhal304r1_c005g0021981 [Plasmopara halstedii]